MHHGQEEFICQMEYLMMYLNTALVGSIKQGYITRTSLTHLISFKIIFVSFLGYFKGVKLELYDYLGKFVVQMTLT